MFQTPEHHIEKKRRFLKGLFYQCISYYHHKKHDLFISTLNVIADFSDTNVSLESQIYLIMMPLTKNYESRTRRIELSPMKNDRIDAEVKPDCHELVIAILSL